MQKRRGVRLTAGLLALALCAGLGAQGAEAGRPGAPSAWAAEDVARAQDLRLDQFSDFVDYQADVTREDFAALAVRLYLAVTRQSMRYDWGEPPFTDVFNTYVTEAWGLGLMQGVSATEFAPQRSITRAEICVLLDRTLNALEAELEAPYATEAAALAAGSEGAVDTWAAEGVKAVVGAGLMQGTEHGYALSETTSREQAVLLCLRAYDAIYESRSAVFTGEELSRIAELKAMDADIRAGRYQGDSPYAVEPDLTAGSYAPGALAEGFLQDGLNAINYVRTIAGLPGDVTYTAKKNAEAQKGALLLAVSEYSHTPRMPEGMDSGMYDAGYAVTSSSNIGYGHGSLYQFNLSCTDDSDNSNLSRVGHRRWLLNPNLQVVGMGYVDAKTTTMVFDHSRTPALSPELVCWPAAGVFPAELAGAGLGWSCTPDPEQYLLAGSTDLTVTLTRERDGAVFELDRSMKDPTAGPYCQVETGGYGYGPTVIFRPEVDGYRHGDVYHVEIDHVMLKSGGTASIEYTVKFYE